MSNKKEQQIEEIIGSTIKDYYHEDESGNPVVAMEIIKDLKKAGYTITKAPEVPKGYFFARHHLVVFSEIESLSAGVINFKSGRSIKTKEVWGGDDTSKFMAAYVSWLDYQSAPRVVYNATPPLSENKIEQIERFKSGKPLIRGKRAAYDFGKFFCESCSGHEVVTIWLFLDQRQDHPVKNECLRCGNPVMSPSVEGVECKQK